VTVIPSLFEVVGFSVAFASLHGTTLLGLRREGLNRSSRGVKRATDIVGASVGLLVTAPIWMAAALAIRLSSPGPVLFRQSRVGRDGRTFTMLKFRTMVDGADSGKAELMSLNEAEGLFKIADDPRITWVGRLLRRSSLDELPQLVNVLRGDMSLVGPRPLVPDDDSRVEGWERRRLRIYPGMTGLWQVFGSSRIPLSEMVKIDYLYGANWSLWLDVKIMLRTVLHVLARRGL
jgi:lipopolysaccharide/colanic/teichoic acid biosynthesis glycosyltransferase